MAKILSKSGDSLADVYDVEGSIAGIDQLQSQDVSLVHELGATIFSERLSSRMIALDSGAIDQSLEWDINFSFAETSRLLAIAVVSSNDSRLANVMGAILSGPAVDNMEVPIFAWDATDPSVSIRSLIAGAETTRNLLINRIAQPVPNLLIGDDSPRPASSLSFRGTTTAFGAGAVTTQLLAYVAFPQTAGLSSRGLPLPSW